MSINRGYYNAQAAQVLNKVEYDSNSNPVGLIESSTDGSSCNFGTDRLPRRGGCYTLTNSRIETSHSIDYSTIQSIEYSFLYRYNTAQTGTQHIVCFSETSYTNISYFGIFQSGGNLCTHHTGHIGVTGLALPTDNQFHVIYVKYDISAAKITWSIDSTTRSESNLLPITGNGYLFIGSTFRNLVGNSISDFKLKINGIINYQYKCDENYGTTCYDSSGNGNHGTIVNAITVTPEENANSIHQYQDIYSYHNEVGYNKSGSVFIPRNESITLPPFKDVLGNDLTYFGKVPGRAKFVESNCFQTFVGGTTYLSNSNSLTPQDFEVSFTLANTSSVTSSSLALFEHRFDTGYGFSMWLTGSAFSFSRHNSGNLSTAQIPITSRDGKYLVRKYGTTLQVYKDSVLLATDTLPASTITYSATYPLTVIGRTQRLYYQNNCKYYDVKFSLLDSVGNYISVLGYWPLCESIINPSGHIYHDVSGNGNHATLVNGTVGNSSRQNEFHYLQKGFNLDIKKALGNSNLLDPVNFAYTGSTVSRTGSIFSYVNTAVGYLQDGGGFSFNQLRPTTIGDIWRFKFKIRYSTNISAILFRIRSAGAAGYLESISTLLTYMPLNSPNVWIDCEVISRITSANNPGILFQIAPTTLTATNIDMDLEYVELTNPNYLPKHLTNNTDYLGNALTYVQDGKSFLPSGCNLRQYQQPSLIQADSTTKFWFDANNEPYDVEYKNLRLVDPIGDRIYIGNKNTNFISPISTHATSLLTRQKNTEKVVRNVVDDPAIDDATFSHDVTVAAGDLTYSLYNPSGWTFNALIDWGDGTTQLVNTTATQTITKTYSVAGTYTVKVTGRMSYMYPGNVSAANALKVVKVNNWGNCGIYRLSFNACQNLVSIPIGPITGLNAAYDLSSLFNVCYKLTGQIQSDLFINAPLTTNLSNLFNGCLLLTGQIPENLFRYCPNLTSVASAFAGCTGLTGQIPEELLRYNTKLTTVAALFQDCSGLSGSIPTNLLKYNILLTTTASLFYNCSKISGQLPPSLLSTLTELASIDQMFRNCTSLSSTIPVDFLRYNTKLVGASSVWYGATGITGNIPTDYFRYNPLLNNVARHFQGTSVNSIPSGLFLYNTLITTYQGTFQDCTGLTSIPIIDLFRYSGTATTNFEATFSGCTGLTSIPADIFRYNTNVTTFASTFYNTRITTIPSGLFQYNTKVTTFASTFQNCTALTAILPGMFDTNTLVTNFASVFSGCTGITSIPTDLFRYNTAVTNMSGVFSGTRITIIPVDIFRYNISVTLFDTTFSNIGTAASIAVPVDLFRYNVNCTSFSYTFGWTKITFDNTLFAYNTKVTNFTGAFYDSLISNIPTDLFKNNTLVTNFTAVLRGGTFTTIPVDLFRYNTLVTSFSQVFDSNYTLTTIPVDIFRYNTAVTDFSYAFRYCYTITIPEDLFYYNSNVTNYSNVFINTKNLVLPTRMFNTANLGKVTTWLNFINVTQTSYSPTGSIQKIWGTTETPAGDVTYVSLPTRTDAFNNCTALTNYSSIPTAWQ